MPAVKTRTQAEENFRTIAPNMQDYFEVGVVVKAGNWEERTAEAADEWREGIRNAANRGLFSRGVHDLGQPEYIARMDEKQGNWIDAVRSEAAARRWRDHWEPYHDLIRMIEEGTESMPDRVGVNTTENFRRVQVIAGLMHDLKLSLAGIDHGSMDERPPGWRW